jgi:glycosyltransferase involved in cell wall biosynthesis
MPQNSGQIAANNAGIAQAKGQYICFLDSDDVFLELKLTKLHEAILSSPPADFYQHQYYYGDEALQICSPAYPYYMRSGNLSDLCQKSGMLTYTPTSNHCYKASFLQKIIPIDPLLLSAHADHPPAMLAHLLGTVHCIPAPLTIYRLHGKNVSHTTKQTKVTDPQSLFKESLNLEKVYLCVNEVLHKIGSPIRADLNKSISFQRCQYVFGKMRFWRFFLSILRTPAIQGLSAKIEFLQIAKQWRKGVKGNW